MSVNGFVWLKFSYANITLQEKRPITMGKIIAIRCYCNVEKVVASCCNKIRGNRLTQHKDLITINSTYCNKDLVVTSLLQQITLWQ